MNNILIFSAFRRCIIVALGFLCIPVISFGQQAVKIDSLLRIVNRQMGDSIQVNALLALSAITDCRDSVKKLSYATRALNVAEKINYKKGVFSACMKMGRISQRCSNDIATALNYDGKGASAAEESGNKTDQEYAYQQMANDYKQILQYNKALEYYRRVIELKADPDIELSALENMGVVYSNVGDFPKSLACYDSSLKLLDALIRASGHSDANDTMQLGELYMNKGDINRLLNDSEKAMACYETVLRFSRQTGNNGQEVKALKGIADMYAFRNNFNKAIEIYNGLLKGYEGKKELWDVAQIYNQLGTIYLETGAADKALEMSGRALQQADSNNFVNLKPEIYLNFGKIYTYTHNLPRAIEYLEKVKELSRRSGALRMQKDALQALSDAYQLAGQPGKSLAAYKEFVAIRDSIYSQNMANEITRIDLQSEYERRQIADSLAQAKKDIYVKLKMQRQRGFILSGYAGLLVVLLLAFFIYRNYSIQKKANISIRLANDKLSHEKQVSENLLLNILPEEVAQELKAKGDVAARMYDNVSVMFTDFINFTAAAERFTPQQLVAELHTCFMAFDQIAEKHNVEKIKTVGDAYVAVAGLPVADPDHAACMIRAALEIRDFMVNRQKEVGASTFDVRIGINSGMLVAGIVGVKKFAYDIWGDTVNIAARMEQACDAGKVNISDTTRKMVEGRFTFEDRGELEAKNKGMLKMYFVEPL